MALRDSSEGKWHREDGVLDDGWVRPSRKKGQEKGLWPETRHLEGLNWEVLVVDEPVINAFCLPGGKIVMFTGLLQHFRLAEEIATVLEHEVGHAVARHAAEKLTKNLWFVILQLVLYQFVMPDIVNIMSILFLRLPFSRRIKYELILARFPNVMDLFHMLLWMKADYIGLPLMASAGYDSRVAPKVYEKLGKITGDSALRGYISTHPSGKKRAQLLARAEVMEEALALYRKP
ncbi:unnamed protein product [Ilex paraguariensis]|uniref:Peptidase M48 domain-containing protein n=1 Tax=Ilex paraguariensis TaxID=185542 RepID=A0ABC8TID6_9AQUA